MIGESVAQRLRLSGSLKALVDRMPKERGMGRKPKVNLPKTLPRHGMALVSKSNVRVTALKKLRLPTAAPLHYTLEPEPVAKWRTRKLPQGGLLKRPRLAKCFGTPRYHSATHQRSSALTVRGHMDAPNTIYFAREYKKE